MIYAAQAKAATQVANDDDVAIAAHKQVVLLSQKYSREYCNKLNRRLPRQQT